MTDPYAWADQAITSKPHDQSVSWWLTADRQHFTEVAERQLPRMSRSKFGRTLKVTDGEAA